MSSPLQATALNAIHRASGARMVDFGGWDMPVNYGSQIEEHHAVRRDAGMFDVSHMCIVDLQGTDARAFLRLAVANNVDKLQQPGRALYTCLLRDDGGVLDDLIIYLVADDWFRVVVNAGTADKDIAWLQALAGKHAPALHIVPRRDLAMIAVQGPQALARVWAALPGAKAATSALKPFSAAFTTLGGVSYFIARTGYTGEDGFEIAVPAAQVAALWTKLAAAGVRPAGLGARDTLRLEAGMNLYGQDMDESVSPLASGLAWTVDLVAPRDFIGRAALMANPPTQALVGLLLEGTGGVLRAHQVVRTAAGDGEITSGTFSPTLGASIALARVPLGVQPGERVSVQVRDKTLAARVVKPPFVRNGQVLVKA